MSIEFTSDCPTTETTKPEPCLCAQMAERWIDAMDGDWSEAVKVNLKAEANPACPFCKGTGIEGFTRDDRPHINWANDNGVRVLATLGIVGEDAPYGEMTIAEARRAVMRARSRSDLSAYTREEEVRHGAPRADENGVVELKPLRVYSPSLDENSIQDRIEQFAHFVEESAARGATLVRWG